MKLITVILVALLLTSINSFGATLTGRQIIDKSLTTNDLPYEADLLRMTIKDSSGHKTIRTMRMYTRIFSDGLYKYLVAFDSPSGIKGTALLTWQSETASDDQWLFLPAIGKLKRIARSEKGNYFMGTDFTYEDLSSKRRNQQRYTRLKDAKIGKTPVYVVRDQSKKGQTNLSQAAYRVLYITKKNFVIVRINFYNRKGKLLKRESFSGFKKVRGTTAWRPTTTIMKNYLENSTTTLKILKRNFSSKAAPASYFTKRHISSKQHFGG